METLEMTLLIGLINTNPDVNDLVQTSIAMGILVAILDLSFVMKCDKLRSEYIWLYFLNITLQMFFLTLKTCAVGLTKQLGLI